MDPKKGKKNGLGNNDAGATGSSEAGEIERGGHDVAMPVLQEAESPKKQLRSVQRTRDKLAGRRNAPAELPKQEPVSGERGSCPHGRYSAAACRVHQGGC
jgi:hypothetical protein